MKSFNEILERYRKLSRSEKDKGTMFEMLMQRFMLTYPPYTGKFSEVWLWNDFPFRQDFGGKDIGIDLVAKTLQY